MRKGVVCLLMVLLAPCVAFAQSKLTPLVLEQEVRTGVLPNGLTYFIRYNQEPKERAEFHIAQKVGSILEEENQRGLAHFLEHMAFNGTKNFPGKTMLQDLQNRGLSFGGNINAYTSIESTVYRLSDVPTKDWGLLDTCLLVLHDWACDITLANEEIDSERGVIREEWRTSSSANRRMLEKQLPELYPGSRYANRLPIGLIDVINNFTYQELRDYYHKWYRPDLQGIVVVGDFDVAEMERRVVKLFGSIPTHTHPAKREMFPVPTTREPIVSIATDPEAVSTLLAVFYKHPIMPAAEKLSEQGYQQNLIRSAVARMFRDRYAELTKKGDQPFTGASTRDGEYYLASTEGAFSTFVGVKEGREKEALRVVLTELERAKRFGFVPSELERAKVNILQELENAYENRNKRKSNHIAEEIINYFIDQEPMPGIEKELTMARAFLPQMSVEMVNALVKGCLTQTDNRVYSLNGKTIAITPQEVLTIAAEVEKDPSIEPYREEALSDRLIATLPKPGKVKKVSTDVLGNEVWLLSNGARVVLKPTDFKDNEILLLAISKGGTSLYSDAESRKLSMLPIFTPSMGLADFTQVQLQRMLAGKTASASIKIESDNEQVTGSAVPKDMETMMQLLYLTFTAPGHDQEGFDAYKRNVIAALRQQEVHPSMTLQDTIASTLYANSLREKRLRAEDVEALTMEQVLNYYKERYANAADFTFIFIGNVDKVLLKKYAEQYIATLPATKKREASRQSEPSIRKGVVENMFDKSTQVPKSTVAVFYSTQMDNTRENRMAFSILSRYLDIKYTEEIREKEGGTYGVAVRDEIKFNPKDEASLMVYFDTNEAQQAKLRTIVEDQIKLIAEKGLDAEDYNKVIGNLLKSNQELQRNNNFWLSGTRFYYLENVDIIGGREAFIRSITPEKVQAIAKQLIESGNKVSIIMNQK